MENSKETALSSLSEGSTKEAKPSPEKAAPAVVASGNLTTCEQFFPPNPHLQRHLYPSLSPASASTGTHLPLSSPPQRSFFPRHGLGRLPYMKDLRKQGSFLS